MRSSKFRGDKSQVITNNLYIKKDGLDWRTLGNDEKPMRNTSITLGLIASLGKHVVANKQKRNLKVNDHEYRHTLLINGTLYLLIRTYFG